ncbi:hypothetical protein NDU88_007493 [Pleurodeles waltl]|uniref:Uncharacterized protein n=1 Tax=Pleurodeles waltl TaxID=8319 RepID=A0AAV7SSX6_PLEWA|nr:hypothetical protein NDU88_007493 [Pleurodeles waltl]
MWLRKLVTYCEFDKFDNEAAIRLHIIEGCHSTAFRTKMLKKTYTLDKILTMACSEARATAHAIQMGTGRPRTMEQAHRMAGEQTKKNRPSLPLKEKHGADLLPLRLGIPAC